MSDPFVAEIRTFPFNFAPTGWAFCAGQFMPLSQNTALFSLLGTTYGGNGQSNFALPDLQGRAPMHPGQGPALSEYLLGESSGSSSVTLLESDMPFHTHALGAQTLPLGGTGNPSGATLSRPASGKFYFTPGSPSVVSLAPEAVALNGGGLPHNNMQPYLALNFCISLQGVFPSRA